MISVLYFDGLRSRTAAARARPAILFDAPTATYHQDNADSDAELDGLWKIADDRTFGSNMFLSASTRSAHRVRPRSRSGGLMGRPDGVFVPHSRSGRSARASTPPTEDSEHRRELVPDRYGRVA